MSDVRAGLRMEFVGCGSGPRPPGWISPWRALPFLLLEWPLRGRWKVESDERPPILITPQSLVVIPEGVNHRFSVVGAEAVTTLYVVLEAIIARRPAIAADGPIRLDGPEARRIHRHGARLRRIRYQTTALRDLADRGAATAELFADLLRALPDERLCPSSPPDDPLCDWIDDHLEHRISRAGMARAAGCSVSGLHRRCKAVLGCSPQAYVSRERLRRARELLAATDLPVATIAARCGFADHHYFSRWFRREAGVTASAFRAACASIGPRR